MIPSLLNDLTDEVVERIYQTYEHDFTGVEITNFKLEIDRWSVIKNPKPNTLSETLQVTNTDLYSSIYTCLLILLCMPVTAATA